jgi:hypothetical protein
MDWLSCAFCVALASELTFTAIKKWNPSGLLMMLAECGETVAFLPCESAQKVTDG